MHGAQLLHPQAWQMWCSKWACCSRLRLLLVPARPRGCLMNSNELGRKGPLCWCCMLWPEDCCISPGVLHASLHTQADAAVLGHSILSSVNRCRL